MKYTISVIAAFLLLVTAVYAYPNEYPPNAPVKGAAYIEAQVNGLGRVFIIIPLNSMEYISQQRGSENLINVTNTTITGRIYTGANFNNEYNYRMSAYGTSQYQPNNNNTWQDITITAIHNTNIPILNNNGENPVGVVSKPTMALWILVFLVGVVVVCLFFKR
ncbi:MAG: hypothetical protein FWG31_07865 [Oscillospiraceae bacterium]|nr:hypothetical protein [Oscillospiraceae bacterium]